MSLPSRIRLDYVRGLEAAFEIAEIGQSAVMTRNREGEHAAERAISLCSDTGPRGRMIGAASALVTLLRAPDIGLEGGRAFADVVQPARNPSSFFPAEGFRELRSAIAYSGEMMRQRLPILGRPVWQRVREYRRHRRPWFSRIHDDHLYAEKTETSVVVGQL